MEQPLDLALTIIQMRAYAAAKRLVDTATEHTELPDDPMIDLVAEITHERVQEARRQRDARMGVRE